jgi:hypothetical protein
MALDARERSYGASPHYALSLRLSDIAKPSGYSKGDVTSLFHSFFRHINQATLVGCRPTVSKTAITSTVQHCAV